MTFALKMVTLWSTVMMAFFGTTHAFSPLQQRLSLRTSCGSIENFDSLLRRSLSAANTIEKEAQHQPTIIPLPQLYPTFADPLQSLGLSTPTPIQAASAQHALEGNNALLIAPTGSGKTLAYLLPALTKALQEDSTLVVVAPTRELAIQLARDADSLLIKDDDNNHQDSDTLEEPQPGKAVQVAVRGLTPPTQAHMKTARMLIGTPDEVLIVVNGASRDFVSRIHTVILDEVDVLVPNQPKSMRTALDDTKNSKSSEKAKRTAQDERRKKEQKRKLLAQKRRGDTDSVSGAIVTPTETILRQVAGSNPQILAGSATASRRTLETLNRVVRKSREGMAVEHVPIVAVRPAVVESSSEKETEVDAVDKKVESDRSITVPSEVMHRFISLTKEEASSADATLSALSKAATVLQPKTALVFLCGEFGRPKVNAKEQQRQVSKKGKTAQARRNNARKSVVRAKKSDSASSSGGSQNISISAREVCTKLGVLGIDAKPLHVALGLEPNVDETEVIIREHNNLEGADAPLPFLVTFEGSARGLHFDAVDAVFVVGRPASASSYLHLAGRVGRAVATAEGDIVNCPGTVVSFCTKGQQTELEKWTKQLGGTGVVELEPSGVARDVRASVVADESVVPTLN